MLGPVCFAGEALGVVARVAADTAETTELGEDQVEESETLWLWPLASRCVDGEAASGVEGRYCW